MYYFVWYTNPGIGTCFTWPLDEFLNRLACRLDVELLIASGSVPTRLATRNCRSFRCLPACKMIIIGNARDRFFLHLLELRPRGIMIGQLGQRQMSNAMSTGTARDAGLKKIRACMLMQGLPV